MIPGEVSDFCFSGDWSAGVKSSVFTGDIGLTGDICPLLGERLRSRTGVLPPASSSSSSVSTGVALATCVIFLGVRTRGITFSVPEGFEAFVALVVPRVDFVVTAGLRIGFARIPFEVVESVFFAAAAEEAEAFFTPFAFEEAVTGRLFSFSSSSSSSGRSWNVTFLRGGAGMTTLTADPGAVADAVDPDLARVCRVVTGADTDLTGSMGVSSFFARPLVLRTVVVGSGATSSGSAFAAAFALPRLLGSCSALGSSALSSNLAVATSLFARVAADFVVVNFSFFALVAVFLTGSGSGSGTGASNGVTFIRRLGAAASVDVEGGAAAAAVVVRVDRDARVAFGSGWAITTMSSSSPLSLTSTTGVDRVVLASFVSAFFETRDFDSMAFVLVVVGTALEVVAGFRFGASSSAGFVLESAARARVTRRGFAGLAGFLGAMLSLVSGSIVMGS